jgi:cytochrome c oxidase subunit 2
MMRGRRRWLLAGLSAAILAVLAGGVALAQGFLPSGAESGVPPQSTLNPAGAQAQIVDSVVTFDILFSAVVFVIVSLVVVYVLIRFRARAGDETLPPQYRGNRGLEIGWTIALAAGLMVMLVEPVKAEFLFDQVPDAQQALQVNVVGHQWFWEFQYPKEGIDTSMEMHVPVGRVVDIHLTSVDVMHAFGVPRLGGKMLAMPGRENELWIKADAPGVYQGQCYELCGSSHARMLFRVIADTPADYEAWVDKMEHPNVDPTDPVAQQGKAFFTGGPCVACHTIKGTNAKGTFGPELTNYGLRTAVGGGLMPNTPENLMAWIHNPDSIKPGTHMPNYNVPPDKLQQVAAFLESMK